MTMAMRKVKQQDNGDTKHTQSVILSPATRARPVAGLRFHLWSSFLIDGPYSLPFYCAELNSTAQFSFLLFISRLPPHRLLADAQLFVDAQPESHCPFLFS